MSKTGKVVLGILTFSPLMIPILYFMFFFSVFFTAGFEGAMRGDQPEPHFGAMAGTMIAIMGLMFFFILIAVGLMVFYIINVANSSMASNMKAVWIVLLLTAWMPAMIAYYFVNILPEPKDTEKKDNASDPGEVTVQIDPPAEG